MDPLKIKKILFPVDFSARCDGAAHYVEAFTGRFQAELVLLHVVESPGFLFGSPEAAGVTLRRVQEDRLGQARQKLNEYLGTEMRHYEVRRVLLEGDPSHEIVRYAHEHDVDLIMLPSHGFGPFRRFVIGSVTAKVLHDAFCPVWTGVHLEQAPPLEAIAFRNILCALDLSPNSERALSWAARLAREHLAKLAVVHAVPEITALPARYMDAGFSSMLAQKARDEITALLEKMKSEGEVVIGWGDPAKAVRTAAEEIKADLVIIARGSAAEGLGRLRTHAYGIIRNSPCPVVSV
jgi:nucleotide-binding universal stress UspA family protein